MSYTEILIALLIASKSGRRNRAFKGWIPIVHWTQKSHKKGQILCHSKADVSQEDGLAGAGSHGLGVVLDPSGFWVRSWVGNTSSAILTISESCFSTDLINCPLINYRVIGHFSCHKENVLKIQSNSNRRFRGRFRKLLLEKWKWWHVRHDKHLYFLPVCFWGLTSDSAHEHLQEKLFSQCSWQISARDYFRLQCFACW